LRLCSICLFHGSSLLTQWISSSPFDTNLVGRSHRLCYDRYTNPSPCRMLCVDCFAFHVDILFLLWLVVWILIKTCSELSSNHSNFYGHGYHHVDAFAPLRSHSGNSHPQFEGAHNSQAMAGQSSAQNGFSHAFQSLPISRISQGGPSPVMGNMYDMPFQGDHDAFVNSWISDIPSQGAMGSPSNRTTVSDSYVDPPAAVDMMHSLSRTTFQSSGHSPLGSGHSSPSDTTVCHNSPQYKMDHPYSKYQEDTASVGEASYHKVQGNVIARPVSHSLTMGPDSTLNMVGEPEDNLFTSPVDIQSQSYFQNVAMNHGLPMTQRLPGTWGSDHTRIASPPVFSATNTWTNTFMGSTTESQSHQDFTTGLPTNYSRYVLPI
jgi:hypothetical protein